MITITSASSLESARELELSALLAACGTVDGAASLPTEKSLNFDKAMKNWFFASEGDALVGLLSIFAPRREEAEISAFVHPRRRRAGIFSALVAQAERELAAYPFTDELLVCDRGSQSGAAAALALGAILDFTEYGMAYTGPGAADYRPPGRPAPQGLEFAEVGSERLAELVELRMDAFGDTREDSESIQRAAFASPERREHVALLGGAVVAACSLCYEGTEVSLNGIGVATARRGRGIGRALIGWTLERLAGSGLRIVLDVESTNERAFGLYKSMGFEVTQAVDYYRRPFSR